MKKNRGVVYIKPGVVEVQEIPYPVLALGKRKCEHGVILKVVLSAICGSDQHMVRGRTTAPKGLVLGHEITGIVVETGRDVEFIKKGDLVSVPFNVACGRCVNCKERKTNLCLNVNPGRPGGAYGYVDMGGWIGGQAEYVMVPYADFNLLKMPPLKQAMPKIKDLALLADIFPTGFHAAYSAGVGVGAIVYIAGAGPVGISCAVSCQLLGAAVVIVGDMKAQRLEHLKKIGCQTIDLSKHADIAKQIEKLLGTPYVDVAIDCVGFEAYAHGKTKKVEQPNIVLNTAIELAKAGGSVGIPGLYVTDDPGAKDPGARKGFLGIRMGLCWSKALTLTMGQTPVMRYNRWLMNAILHDKCQIAKAVGAKIISLDEAPKAYEKFSAGAPNKFLIDPHGMVE
jgi:glutathione-independent formaldehyde dehydrogenase